MSTKEWPKEIKTKFVLSIIVCGISILLISLASL
jgi:hypothetical protein